jgi:hypothetical protein
VNANARRTMSANADLSLAIDAARFANDVLCMQEKAELDDCIVLMAKGLQAWAFDVMARDSSEAGLWDGGDVI